MAIIHVTKDLRINGTQRAWQVEQAKAVHGRLRWEPTNWFATLPAAIQFLVERDIRAAPIEGVAEVIEYAKRVADQYADKVAVIAGDTQGFAAGHAPDGKLNPDTSGAAQSTPRISLVGRS